MTKYNTLYDLLKLGLNNKTKAELHTNRYFAVDVAIKELDRYIQDAKINNKSIRKERQEVMIKILTSFYNYLYTSKSAQVCPSMKTLAFSTNPNLKKVNKKDSIITIKQKEKDIHAAIMRVQRAIETLEKLNIIKVHKYYRSDNHFNSKKAPCYFYELLPLSNFSRKYSDVKQENIIEITKTIEEEINSIVESQDKIKNSKNTKVIGTFSNVMKYYKESFM